MPTALFYNFSDEDFVGRYGGQNKMFPAGSKTYMPAYLAQHFAKHLTNRELLKEGKDTATSPKAPEDVPEFEEKFKRAYVRDRDMEKKKTSLDQEIDAVNLNRQGGEASMNIPPVSQPSQSVQEKEPEKELDLNNVPGESGKGSVILSSPDDDEDEDENEAFESKPAAPAPVAPAPAQPAQAPLTVA